MVGGLARAVKALWSSFILESVKLVAPSAELVRLFSWASLRYSFGDGRLIALKRRSFGNAGTVP